MYWTTSKNDKPLAQMNTNAFLFFLQRVIDGPTTYRDVTGDAHPFVRASEANIRLLSSKLTDKK
jgi:hypothetical protein